jgi:hypothetical protein
MHWSHLLHPLPPSLPSATPPLHSPIRPNQPLTIIWTWYTHSTGLINRVLLRLDSAAGKKSSHLGATVEAEAEDLAAAAAAAAAAATSEAMSRAIQNWGY